jgi:hypothetical protein
MSNTEYVKISGLEKNYSQKNLLQGQAYIISSIKHLKSYHNLRKKELLLRIKLKSLIENASSSLNSFEKSLPDVSYESETLEAKKEKQTLDKELEDIKLKLHSLSHSENLP